MGYGKQRANATPAHALRERLEAGKCAIEANLMRANDDIARRTGGGSLRPFFLLPDPCWNGAMGQFLMQRLGLFPYDDWNIALLPVDERTAFMLDAPMHPDGNLPAFEKASAKFLAREEAFLRDAHADADSDAGDAREQVRGRVKALAGFFLAELTKVWRQRHPVPAFAH